MQSDGGAEDVPKEVKWLWQGCKTGDVAGCKRLLDQGVDPNYPFGDSAPLHAASMAGHLDLVRLLLERGANVNQPMDPWYEANIEAGMSPLHLAIREGHVDVVEALLQGSADVEKSSWFPNLIKPIHVALDKRSAHCLELLLRAGADADARTGPEDGGRTALHMAVASEWVAGVEMLVRAGCRTDIKDESGKTPLDAASPKMRKIIQQGRRAKL